MGLNLIKMSEVQRDLDLRIVGEEIAFDHQAYKDKSRRARRKALKQRDLWYHRVLTALQIEVGELIESHLDRDIDNCKIELVDCMHFVLTLCRLIGYKDGDYNRAELQIKSGLVTPCVEDWRLVMRMSAITSQLYDLVPWKWWSKQTRSLDSAWELIDRLMYCMGGLITAYGMTFADFEDLYIRKVALNHKRQEEGYREGTYNKDQNGIEDNRYLVEGGVHD
jgi:dimeric dUTPase (all-alpha-NTP-PPase superfamily)